MNIWHLRVMRALRVALAVGRVMPRYAGLIMREARRPGSTTATDWARVHRRAALELKQALLVNPFDVDGIANALETALDMDDTEQRRRMSALRRNVRGHNVHDWADGFIKRLRSL